MLRKTIPQKIENISQFEKKKQNKKKQDRPQKPNQTSPNPKPNQTQIPFRLPPPSKTRESHNGVPRGYHSGDSEKAAGENLDEIQMRFEMVAFSNKL